MADRIPITLGMRLMVTFMSYSWPSSTRNHWRWISFTTLWQSLFCTHTCKLRMYIFTRTRTHTHVRVRLFMFRLFEPIANNMCRCVGVLCVNTCLTTETRCTSLVFEDFLLDSDEGQRLCAQVAAGEAEWSKMVSLLGIQPRQHGTSSNWWYFWMISWRFNPPHKRLWMVIYKTKSWDVKFKTMGRPWNRMGPTSDFDDKVGTSWDFNSTL